jgi:hypothetical protein
MKAEIVKNNQVLPPKKSFQWRGPNDPAELIAWMQAGLVAIVIIILIIQFIKTIF